MPIYEYGCKNCSHTLDALQKMSDEPLTECPECGQSTLKRLISAPRFRLKGSGWYETDFKKDNQRNLAKGDSESTAKSDKPDGKQDGKKDGAAKDADKSSAPAKKTGSGTAAAAE